MIFSGKRVVVLTKKCVVYECMITSMEKRILDQTRELNILRRLKQDPAPVLRMVLGPAKEAV